MALAPRLDLRQSQTLVMTPQLQQAIKLLQLSNLELSAYVEAELEQNPLLERDENSPEPGTVAAEPSDAPVGDATVTPRARRAGRHSDGRSGRPGNRRPRSTATAGPTTISTTTASASTRPTGARTAAAAISRATIAASPRRSGASAACASTWSSSSTSMSPTPATG